MSASRARSVHGMDPWWVAFGVVCAVGIVAMIALPSSSERAARTDAVAEGDVNLPRDAAKLAPLDSGTKASSKASATSAAARTRTPDGSTPGLQVVDDAHTPSTHAASADSPTTSGQAVASSEVQPAALVTIQGCLQAEDNAFWLKDTSGADAPKARSWKSGFLKKRSASVEVVDAGRALNLSRYAGQRVAASGMLADRRFQVRSLHSVAGSCN